MELLIPAVIVVLNQVIMWISKKAGIELGRALVLIIAFVLSAGAAYVYQILPVSFVAEAGTIFASQMAIYEVLVKTVLKPALDPKDKTQILPEVDK